MKAAARVLLGVALAVAAGADGAEHTEEQIRRKGMEIMEEGRQVHGHWVHVHRAKEITHMEDHIGPNGLAFLGFFVGEHVYKEHADDPDQASRHQADDDLWVEFKRLAEDQSWIEKLGMGHKQWTFAYSHDRKLADEYGCAQDNKGKFWDHVCIIAYKTSRTGKTTFMHPVTRMTPEAHEHMANYVAFRHKPEHLLPQLQKIVKVTVRDPKEEL